jgi:hypothetical protein
MNKKAKLEDRIKRLERILKLKNESSKITDWNAYTENAIRPQLDFLHEACDGLESELVSAAESIGDGNCVDANRSLKMASIDLEKLYEAYRTIDNLISFMSDECANTEEDYY